MSKSHMKKDSNKNNSKLISLKAQAAIDRIHFFANGGDLSQWRGLHSVSVDKKKQLSRRACRGKKWQK